MIVGIGEYAISNNVSDCIKTFALASCVALTVYSNSRRAAGMIHLALPFPTDSYIDVSRPAYYASTGIPLFIDEMCKQYGCYKGALEIQIYGGANSVKYNDMFNIGKRNIDAVKSILSSLNLEVKSIDVGGNISRSVEIDVASGKVKVWSQPLYI